MEHDSSTEQTEPKKRGAATKKILGIVLFFLGLVAILGGYVAAHVLQSGIVAVLGLITGFILIVGGSEFSGIE